MKLRIGFVSNSSSSCFICNYHDDVPDKKMTLKQVRQKLEDILDAHNKLYERKVKFEDMFAELKIADKGDIEQLKPYFDCHKEQQAEAVKKKDMLSMMMGSYLPDYKPLKGKTLIYSVKDNSIPYELFELIENYFKAIRVHLG